MGNLKYVVERALKKGGQKAVICSESGTVAVRAILVPQPSSSEVGFEKPGFVENQRYKVMVFGSGLNIKYGNKLVVEKRSYFIENFEEIYYGGKVLYINLSCVREGDENELL